MGYMYGDCALRLSMFYLVFTYNLSKKNLIRKLSVELIVKICNES